MKIKAVRGALFFVCSLLVALATKSAEGVYLFIAGLVIVQLWQKNRQLSGTIAEWSQAYEALRLQADRVWKEQQSEIECWHTEYVQQKNFCNQLCKELDAENQDLKKQITLLQQQLVQSVPLNAGNSSKKKGGKRRR